MNERKTKKKRKQVAGALSAIVCLEASTNRGCAETHPVPRMLLTSNPYQAHDASAETVARGRCVATEGNTSMLDAI